MGDFQWYPFLRHMPISVGLVSVWVGRWRVDGGLLRTQKNRLFCHTVGGGGIGYTAKYLLNSNPI